MNKNRIELKTGYQQIKNRHIPVQYDTKEKNIAEKILALQRTAGNAATREILSLSKFTIQRMHHTEEARQGDHREGAIEELSYFKQNTLGYSLWGVYKTFNNMPTTVVGDGSGLRTLVRNNKEFLERPVSQDPAQRQRDSEEWGKKESTAFEHSSDKQTRTAGAWLAPQTRGTLFSMWQTGGMYIPNWIKSKPKE